VPAQDCIRSQNRGHLLRHPSAEHFAFNCQRPALVIVEQDTFHAELLSEHTILGPKVLDHVLLLAIDPAGQDQDQ
jgi:hypothetical protein